MTSSDIRSDNSVHRLAETALLLALCIVSQFFKNLSPLITGPVINCIIIIAVLMIGLSSGIIISVISPLTSFFIAPSPVLQGIPLIVPVIMAGNCILAVCVWFFSRRLHFIKGPSSLPSYAGMLTGSVIKALFMGLIISYVLIPAFSANIALPSDKLNTLLPHIRFMFGLMQLITALIGSLLASLILIPLKKAAGSGNS